MPKAKPGGRRRSAAVLSGLLTSTLMMGAGVPAAVAEEDVRTGVISGTVTAPAGADIAGVRVYATTASYLGYGSSAVASDGSYSIDGLPAGAYQVRFDTRGNGLVTEWYDDQLSANRANLVNLATDESKTGIDADLIQGSTI